MKVKLQKLAELSACHIALIGVFALIIMALLPLFITSRYILRVITLSMLYVVLSLSLNLLIGYLGQMSMGHAAFWGVGAYAGAILSTRFSASIWAELAAAILVSALLGLLLGLPVMKLKGYYLTIVTMGFCEILRLVELNSMSITRGPLGITGIKGFRIFGLSVNSPRGYYYVFLFLVVFTVFILHRFSVSRLGLAVKAIRENELAAQAMGIHVFACKLAVFSLSAAIAGVAGVFYAHYQTMVMPSQFTTGVSMQIVTMTIFGGLGNIAGSILGAFSLTFLPELLRGLDQYRQLFYGILIVLMMLVKPNGLLGSLDFAYIRQRHALKERKEDHA